MHSTDKLEVVAIAAVAVVVLASALLMSLIPCKADQGELAVAAAEEESTNLV
jgi:hypothetical protein